MPSWAPTPDYADHVGERLLQGTIVSPDGSTAALQIQLLRPPVSPEQLAEHFSSEAKASIAKSLSAVDRQRIALQGIDHFLAVEAGWSSPTPEYLAALNTLRNQPTSEQQQQALLKLTNPTENFAQLGDTLIRKYTEFRPQADGTWLDSTNPDDPLVAAADFEPKPRSSIHFRTAGMPVLDREFEIVGMADMKYQGYTFLLASILLLICFRRVSGMVAPIATVLLSIAAMMGTVTFMGDLLNNLTAIAPHMVIAVGIADAVHLVASYFGLRRYYTDKQKLLIEVIRRNALPVFLTSCTTAIGFFSLMVSDIMPMRALGYTAGLGAVYAYVLSMTLVPAVLSLLPVAPDAQAEVDPDDLDHTEHWGDSLALQ